MITANLDTRVGKQATGKAAPVAPILAGVIFKSDPMTFRDLCQAWAEESGAWSGHGKATGQGETRKWTDRHYIFELYGDVKEGTKRPRPTAKVWIGCRASNMRLGAGAPATSTLYLEMRQGEYAKVAPQVEALLGTLRHDGWLVEPKQVWPEKGNLPRSAAGSTRHPGLPGKGDALSL
jgi:hypothetical protein